MVRATGLEPAHTKAPDPKSGVSANFTTPAIDQQNKRYQSIAYLPYHYIINSVIRKIFLHRPIQICNIALPLSITDHIHPDPRRTSVSNHKILQQTEKKTAVQWSLEFDHFCPALCNHEAVAALVDFVEHMVVTVSVVVLFSTPRM